MIREPCGVSRAGHAPVAWAPDAWEWLLTALACAPPIGAFVVECLEHAALYHTCISPRSTTTRDGHIPQFWANHPVV